MKTTPNSKGVKKEHSNRFFGKAKTLMQSLAMVDDKAQPLPEIQTVVPASNAHSSRMPWKRTLLVFQVVIIIVYVVILSLLAVLVFSGSGVTATDPTENPMFASYLAAPKSLYVWSPSAQKEIDGSPAWRLLLRGGSSGAGAYLLSFCQRHQIGEVKLYVGCIEWEGEEFFSRGQIPEEDGLSQLVDSLGEAGISVTFLTYVNDDPNTLTGWEGMSNVIRATRRFNEGRTHKVKGIHIDQEPWVSTEYTAMMDMVKAAKRIAVEPDEEGSEPLRIEMSIKPQWLTELWTDASNDGLEAPFATHLLMASGSGGIMAYSNILSKVKDYAVTFGTMAAGVSAVPQISIETGTKGATADSTLAGYLESPSNWFTVIGDLFDEIRTEIPVIESFAIHDYVQYHQGLYSTDPYYSDSGILQYMYRK